MESGFWRVDAGHAAGPAEPANMNHGATATPASGERFAGSRIGALPCVMQDIVYAPAMHTSTLTIRLPVEQREALRRSAKAIKKTESEYIRELLQRDLDSRPFGEQAGQFIVCLDSSQTVGEPHPLRDLIRERNWRK
jgi:hypothetical protein